MPNTVPATELSTDPIRAHIEMLHGLAKGVDGVLVVSVFHASPTGDADVPGTVTHHAIGDVDGMVEAIQAQREVPGANVYTGLQVMRRGLGRGKRGTEADIVAVLGLVADMDSDTGRSSGEYPLSPDYVIETSPGNMQPFWLFDRPLAPAVAKEIASGLKVVTGSDHGTGDITHVWRVPGLGNWPNKKKLSRGRSPEPAAVTVIEPWGGSLTDPTALALAVAGRSSTTIDTRHVELGELPAVDGIDVSAKLAAMLAANDVGDRSDHAARVVEEMGFVGLPLDEGAALFLTATGDWLHRYPTEERARSDFVRMWGKFVVPREEVQAAGAEIGARLAEKHKSKEPGKQLPAAANDNKPQPVLDIFAWKSSRFVGEPPSVEYLIDGVVPLAVPMLVAAMGDTGKSFAMLEAGRRVAFGEGRFESPIFGGNVKRSGTAVFITSEDDEPEVHRRLAALDNRGDRLKRGDKLIVIPLPSAGGAFPFWHEKRDRGLEETPQFRRFADQLSTIDDLLMVGIDPLASFAHLPINEDPAAGAFVCASIGRLAAETGATVAVAHHMKKTAKAVENLSEAREAIRGSTAIVDGVRLAYALWPAETDRAKRICKDIGRAYSPNAIAFGGVVKANGAARRVLSTYARNDFGLLVDVTAKLGGNMPERGDLRSALVVAIEGAAGAGRPFKLTGNAGLFANRERLPDDVRGLSRHRIEGLAREALERGEIVKAAAKGEKAADWLDVPTGWFAHGLGEFKTGAAA